MENASFKGQNSIFSTRLRYLLNKNGLTKQALSEVVNTSRQAISQYCDGSTIPNADKLMEIAKYFNVTTDFLVGLSNVETTDTNLQAVCKYTGLSEKAIEWISTDGFQYSLAEIINFLFENDDINESYFWSTLKSYITTKVTDKTIVIQDNGELYDLNTTDPQENEDLFSTLTVGSITTEKLLTAVLFEDLKKELERMRNIFQSRKDDK